jgi:hypothetical protein
MKRLLPIVALVAALSSVVPLGLAQEDSEAPPSEMLKFAPPEGWKLLHSVQSSETRRAVFVPSDQDERTWEDMLIVSTTRGPGMPGLQVAHERTLDAYKSTCQAHTAGALQKKVEKNIGKAFWIQGCNRRKDRDVGEASFNLFIQGQRAVYMIQRIWVLPPFGKEGPPIPSDEQRATMELLSKAMVCDPTAGTADCSPGATVQ